MTEITQKLGFDTSGAVSAISSLDKALGGLNIRLRAFNTAANGSNNSKVVKGFAQVDKAAAKADSAVGKFAKTTVSSSRTAAKGVQKVTFAFSGLAKALLARTAVQAITAMTGAILDSADAAQEFELTMARISNIAQGPGSSIDELTASLSQLAVELGRPQAEVAEAAWEALQNDLGSTKETMDLLAGAANNLALVTGGTLTQAVNSLSSVLKAYNLDISKADEISDQFFAAIDKGRITLKELESSLGKITPLAAKLDIEFREVAAAMAAITQSGTSASVANTQLRSIMQKLIRPTTELQAAFNKLGVETFQELIAKAGGLQPALEGIADALDRDDAAIAKAFGRLRGQLGVFNLLAHDGKIFASTLEAVTDSAGAAADAADKIDGTNAREAQRAWAEFDETLRQVGETVLKVQTEFVKAFNNIISSGEAFSQVLGQIGAAALAVGAAAAAVWTFNAALTALKLVGISTGAAVSVAFAPFLLVAGLSVGIVAALMAIKNAFHDNIGGMVKDSKTAVTQIEKELKDKLKQNSKDIKDILDNRGQIVEDYLKGLSKAFDRETEILKTAADIISGTLKASIKQFESGMNGVFDRMENKIENVTKNLTTAKDTLRSAVLELDDFRFDTKQERREPFKRSIAAINRAYAKAKALEEILTTMEMNPEVARIANIAFEEALKAARNARKEADALEDTDHRKQRAVNKAISLEEALLALAVQIAENDVTKLTAQEASAAAAASELLAQKAITDELFLQLDALEKKLKVQKAGLSAKTPEEKAAEEKSIQDTEKKISDISALIGGQIYKTLGEEKNIAKLGAALQRGFEIAQYDFGNLREAIVAKLNEAEFKIKVEAVVNRPDLGNQEANDRLSQVAAEQPSVMKQAEALREESGKILLESQNNLSESNSLTKIVSEHQKVAEAGAGRYKQMIKDHGDLIAELPKEMSAKFENIMERMLDPDVTAEELAVIKTQLENWLLEFDAKDAPEIFKGLNQEEWRSSIEAVIAMVDPLTKRLELMGKTLTPEAGATLLAYINGLSTAAGEADTGMQGVATSTEAAAGSTKTMNTELEGTAKKGEEAAKNIGKIPKQAKDSGTALTGVKKVVSAVTAATGAAIRAMNALAAAARAALAAVRAANAAAAGGSKYHGGKVNYRAKGGPTRGQDTILTATSPGEYVMNSKSTRQFYSQLQAMNAGQTPQYRDKGGPVTNIGDINVNVSSDTASPQLGRSIASELRRELRRQTSTI